MGQQEINDFLKKHETQWFNTNDIVKVLNISKAWINKCLSRMRKYSEIKEQRVKVIFRSRFGIIHKEIPFYSYKNDS